MQSFSSVSRRGTMLCAATITLNPLPAFAQGSEPLESDLSLREALANSFLPNLWDLAVQGGWFMVPIAVASVITLAFALERLIGLRSGHITPRHLIRRLRKISRSASQTDNPRVDPQKIWELCESSRSPLGRALKAAVLKTGRPMPEIEKSVEDAVRRETALMMRNLRPVNVVASIAPLLGLLGTVQGMIMAFMVTSTTNSTGTAKAQELATGIYTALVTTFAGLSVAVISVVLANLLEGRVEKRLRQLEEIFLDFLPLLEPHEGRVRVSEKLTESGGLHVKQLSVTQRQRTTRQKPRPEKNKSAHPLAPPAAASDAETVAVSGEKEQSHGLWDVISKKG